MVQKSRPRIKASNPEKLKTTDAIRITITGRFPIPISFEDLEWFLWMLPVRPFLFHSVKCSNSTLRLAIDTQPYTAAVTMNALIVRDRRLFLRAKIKKSKTQANVFE